jgi:hypothetical protein
LGEPTLALLVVLELVPAQLEQPQVPAPQEARRQLLQEQLVLFLETQQVLVLRLVLEFPEQSQLPVREYVQQLQPVLVSQRQLPEQPQLVLQLLVQVLLLGRRVLPQPQAVSPPMESMELWKQPVPLATTRVWQEQW